MIAALVPAAGRSTRMGRPKLILPIAGITVIARVVSALREGGVDRVLVVVPPAEQEGATALRTEAQAAGADVAVLLSPTFDMRETVEFGMDVLEEGPLPEAILLAPGDSPSLSPELVAAILRAHRPDSPQIVVPFYGGRRGHPLLMPWDMAVRLRELPPGLGINTLVRRAPTDVTILEVDMPGALGDLDTPEDYRRWLGPEP